MIKQFVDEPTDDFSKACQNTDREIWRGPDEGCGDYYADSLHITKEGSLGINCGGTVYVKPFREWHKLASASQPSFPVLGPACAACGKQPHPDCDNPACAFRGF